HLLAAEEIDQLVTQDGEEKCFNAGVFAKALDPLEERDERVLYEIFGFFLARQPRARERQQPALVGAHELRPAFRVAAGDLLEEVAIGITQFCHTSPEA